MLLLNSSPELEKGAVYEAGYAVGYFVGTYLIEILIGIPFFIALVAFLIIRSRKKKLQQEY